MTARIFGSIPAALITVSLFLLMNILITPQGGIPKTAVPGPKIVITRPQREEVSKRKPRIKPDRPVVTENQPPPIIKTSARVNPSAEQVSIALPTYSVANQLKVSAAPANRRANPLVRIPPQYPHGAELQGIEGWVLVEFTITSAGTVEDIAVIDAQPANIFNSATIRAVKERLAIVSANFSKDLLAELRHGPLDAATARHLQ